MLSLNHPTTEGYSPVRVRLSGVTRKVSSYSIHTLLCSVEHKHPSSDGLRKSRYRPLYKAAQYILLLRCKVEASEATFQRSKRQPLAKTIHAIFCPCRSIAVKSCRFPGRAVRVIIAAGKQCRTDLRIYCQIVVWIFADVRMNINPSKQNTRICR